jgi:integrase
LERPETRTKATEALVAYWKENARPLAAFFDQTPLCKIDSGMIAAHQNARVDAGRAPRTINGEVSVLRQVLRHAKLWYRIEDEYRPLKNTKPPVGQALTDEQQQGLLALAESKPAWLFAYVAATLSFCCGLRACEIKGLQWKHVDWPQKRLEVRRSKTPAGWRDPSLNQRCLAVLTTLRNQATAGGFAEPDHFLFPWHGRDKKIDPTKAMTSWKSAWRSLRKAAGLGHVRFHHGRHTALTRLSEAGQPDWVIQAQLGHVSPSMMKTYSHVRRKALDAAAAVLEPVVTDEKSRGTGRGRVARCGYITSYVTIGRCDRRDRGFSDMTGDAVRGSERLNESPWNQPCADEPILKATLRVTVRHHRAGRHEDERGDANHGPADEYRKQKEQTGRPRDDRTHQSTLS